MLSSEQARKLDQLLNLYRRRVYSGQEFSQRLGHIARPDNVAEVVLRIPTEFADSAKSAAEAYQPVKAVGYWRSLPKYRRTAEYDSFPDPRALVCPAWRVEDRPFLIGYLRAGLVYARWRGFSYCRLECGIDHGLMGTRCFTDGKWVWPEGLAHYVEAHQVRLPDEFVEEMKHYGWQVPAREAWPTYNAQGHPDYDFWIAWGNRQAAWT